MERCGGKQYKGCLKYGDWNSGHFLLNMWASNPLSLPVGQNVKNPQLPKTLSLNWVFWLRPTNNTALNFK